MNLTYKHTKFACYLAYTIVAVINNYTPLLFIIFQKDFGISLVELSMVITANFGVQLIVDFICSRYVNRIGYRRAMICALTLAMLGLILLGTLPRVISPFLGIIIAVITYAIGSGMMEVVISPTVEALPGDNKESDMSILHSFYSWGSIIVIVGTTLFFGIWGMDNWSNLCYLWAVLPLFALILFLKVPIMHFGEDVKKVSYKKIFSNGIFKIFLVVMLCAGASEIAMAQWASLFAETGLGVSKTMGDLLGPCFFALTMGLTRIFFGKHIERFNLFDILLISSAICAFGYLVAVFSKEPIISLIGCAVVGIGVAMMWPVALSLASKYCSFAGAALFGLLAMSGDIGCCIGPTFVAQVSSKMSIYNSPLKAGLLGATIFPLILMLCSVLLKTKIKREDVKIGTCQD